MADKKKIMLNGTREGKNNIQSSDLLRIQSVTIRLCSIFRRIASLLYSTRKKKYIKKILSVRVKRDFFFRYSYFCDIIQINDKQKIIYKLLPHLLCKCEMIKKNQVFEEEKS